MRLLALALVVVASPSGTVHAQDDSPVQHSRFLVGTIGTLPIRMELSVEGGKITGSYFYEGQRTVLRTVIDPLFLDGTLDASGRFELKESTSDVNDNQTPTGVLKGTLTTKDSGYAMAGTWTKPDGSKPLPLAATEVLATPGGVRIVDTPIVESDPHYKKMVTGHYPQFQGPGGSVAKLNAAVKAEAAKFVADFKESVGDLEDADAGNLENLADDVDYHVTLATDDLVSIEFEIYTDFGGAHPSSYVSTLNFDLRAGRKLAIGDVFRKGSNALGVLSAKARPLFKGDFEATADTTPKPENFADWYLTPRGLTVAFSVAHVFGDTAEVYYPFAEIKALIDPASPVAALAK